MSVRGRLQICYGRKFVTVANFGRSQYRAVKLLSVGGVVRLAVVSPPREGGAGGAVAFAPCVGCVGGGLGGHPTHHTAQQ